MIKRLKAILMLFVMVNFASYVNCSEKRDFFSSPVLLEAGQEDNNNALLTSVYLNSLVPVLVPVLAPVPVRITRAVGGCLAMGDRSPEPRPFSPYGHSSNNPFDYVFTPRSPIKVANN